jgi:hypothetical protein
MFSMPPFPQTPLPISYSPHPTPHPPPKYTILAKLSLIVIFVTHQYIHSADPKKLKGKGEGAFSIPSKEKNLWSK